MTEYRYTPALVAKLLMLAAELYQQITSAGTKQYDPAALCEHGRPYYDYRANGRRGRACRTCIAAEHATIVGRPNLSDSQKEWYLDALIDLDEAMNKLYRGTRLGVGRFLAVGPAYFDDRSVTFRYGQERYITTLARVMNGDEEATRERR